MKGEVLDYSVEANRGIISGSDGARYSFEGKEWKAGELPQPGTTVDFEARGEQALAVYKPASLATTGQAAPATATKSNVAAGLFAILLGGLGIHKFYLGYVGPGLLYLLMNTIGWVVTIFLLGIPNAILGVMALIEGIIYLTKSQEEFEQTYVVGRRPWF